MNVEQRIALETQIVNKLLAEILIAGHRVRIENGGDEDFESNDLNLLMKEVNATDEEYINIVDSVTGDIIGWFWLVYGNDGYDVIADHTCNNDTMAIVDKVQPLIDQLEQEWS